MFIGIAISLIIAKNAKKMFKKFFGGLGKKGPSKGKRP
jgi:hypothetical protein